MGEDPDRAVSREWHKLVVAAREKAGLTQAELAARCGTTQNTISLIESGESKHSKFVSAVCRVLKISPPILFQSDEQAEWADLGHRLEYRSKEKFLNALNLVRSMLVPDEPETPPKPPPKKRARVVGRAHISTPGLDGIRAGDELPGERPHVPKKRGH